MMATIDFKLSKLLTVLKSNLLGHKVLLKFEYKSVYFEILSTKIEDNLFLLSIKINCNSPIKVVQEFEIKNEWAAICQSRNNISIIENEFLTGTFVFLGDKPYKYEINTHDHCLNCLIINNSFIKTYNYSKVFELIREEKITPYFIRQPLSSYFINDEERKIGLIKAKALTDSYLYDLKINVLGLKKKLQENITTYCQTALEKNEDLTYRLQLCLGINNADVCKLFTEVFNQDISKFYNNFKITLCRDFFLQDDLDSYIVNHILMPYPRITDIATKFNLPLSKVNAIFLSVKGERLFQYCNKVKFKVTKELIVSEKDISQVVSKTKFINTRSLHRFFVKREGMTVRRYKLRKCNSL